MVVVDSRRYFIAGHKPRHIRRYACNVDALAALDIGDGLFTCAIIYAAVLVLAVDIYVDFLYHCPAPSCPGGLKC